VILCVAANPSIDKLLEVDRVVAGEIHRPGTLVQVPGGKGLNVARSAHALGAIVRATGILGGHAGRWLVEALEAEGVPGTFAWVDAETRTSFSIADRETGGLTEFYERGDDVGADGWDRLEEVVRGALPGMSWMTMSGNLPPGAPDDGYARLIGLARSAGVRSALDARERALVEGIDAGPEIVKLNAEEAGWLLGSPIASLEQARAAAEALRTRLGSGAGIVTCGAEGALVAGPDGGTLHGRLYVKGPYPVGSGDAFLGGLVTALDRGDAWRDAVALALGAATANAEMPGAGRLDPIVAVELAARADLSTT
jgi:1-phosphofructokinase family hexose kinase